MALDLKKLAEEKLNQLNTKKESTGTGVDFVQLKDGKNTVRILPPVKGFDSFFVETLVHYGVGKTKDNKGTMVVCPKTGGDHNPCPVCELAKKYRDMSSKKGDDFDKQAKELYHKSRIYFNAIDRSIDFDNYEFSEEDNKWTNTETGKTETPYKVLGVGVGIFKSVLGTIVDPEYGDITDPVEGIDMNITKSGSGRFDTKYEVKPARRESPIGVADWEIHSADLRKLAEYKSYDELTKLMNGESPSNSASNDDDDSDVKPSFNNAPSEDLDPDSIEAEIQRAIERKSGK